MNYFHRFEDTIDHVIKNIVAVSKEIDLEMKVNGVTELLESYKEELSAQNLEQLEKHIIEEEEEDPPHTLRLSHGMACQKVLPRYRKHWKLLRLKILTLTASLRFPKAS